MNDTQDGAAGVGATGVGATAAGAGSAHYRAYLLRIWNGNQAGWQASLQDAKTGVRLGFSSLEELFAFLMDETERTERERKDGVDHSAAHPPSA